MGFLQFPGLSYLEGISVLMGECVHITYNVKIGKYTHVIFSSTTCGNPGVFLKYMILIEIDTTECRTTRIAIIYNLRHTKEQEEERASSLR